MALQSALKKFGIDAYLIMLLGVVVLACILPARGPFAEFVGQAAYYAVALLFFVYGAKLKSEAVIAGFSNWPLQLSILGLTYLVFPLIALALAFAGREFITDELAIGLIYIGILPSTVQSSIAFTALAKGNVAASVCAAAVSNLLGVILTPLLATLILQAGDGGLNGAAVLNIAIQIVLPFGLGQLCRPLIGEWINRHKLISLTVDRGSILLIVYAAFSAGMVAGVWTQVGLPQLAAIMVLVCVMLAVVLALSAWFSRAVGFQDADGKSMIFCGSTKSLASGVPIANILFAGGPLSLIILPLMLYHQLQLIVCAIIAQRMASKLD
ncbi:MAG: bile acid:sodium symporter [Devosia sp.]|jgi:sodium/bile acid cotransporter 7|uniref:bile acid:sodium symporter family protein n=1 Tax=unclassified Devosia TaxID=196773 RepID=UPI0019FD373D|nr:MULTISPECIES: bile acid:sodium symporter family protein [unclassified Devosia]MBF0678279.1 bile acid:sodium symporter [Devosia sp.]WEJ31533.1 bile acid:sodium symporter [Devosia sp. SD17-2]